MFSGIYTNKKILVTGHTGFKGSWLITWLKMLDANVAGLSLSEDDSLSHFKILNPEVQNYFADIRNLESVQKAFNDFQPDFVFHLAAQSLVIPSYNDPIETWSTNVMGTINVMEAMRHTPSVTGGVMITTDKCYRNKERAEGYNEEDELGGHDPYSASKAADEIAIESYRSSFFETENKLIASGRAGNVIGGGDWSDYRIIPDIVRALGKGDPLIIRNPQSSRPWQHVLESLSGYLILGQKLLQGDSSFARAYNFGPQNQKALPVIDIVHQFEKTFSDLSYEILSEGADKPHETKTLQLDSSLAVKDLQWLPVWDSIEGVEKTIEWYEAYLSEKNIITTGQIDNYMAQAKIKNIAWAMGA